MTSRELVPFQLFTSQHVELLCFLPICHRIGSSLTLLLIGIVFGAGLIFFFYYFFSFFFDLFILITRIFFIYFFFNFITTPLILQTIYLTVCKMEERRKKTQKNHQGERIVASLSLNPIFPSPCHFFLVAS